MKKILISLIAFFILSLTYAQNLSQQQLNYIHKKSKSLLEEYEQYFNLVGDINEPHNDREGVYIPSFTGLFIDEAAIHYNDLDPEEKTSVQLPINQYALNTMLWYPVGVKNILELLDVKYGKVQQISSNSYYINVYVNRTISGLFMDEILNRSTTKLEFRVSFVPNGQLFNNFRIAGVTLAGEDIVLDNTPTATVENNNSKVVDDELIHSDKLNNFIGNSGNFTDSRDGNDYKWVRIGNQIWMAENLNYEIQKSWCYDKKEINCTKYGRLYKYSAAEKACPVGWHLSSDNEWKLLEIYLGMSKEQVYNRGYRGTDEGRRMKSSTGWNKGKNGTNSSGFNALPGGGRRPLGSFHDIDFTGSWWSPSGDVDSYEDGRYIGKDKNQVGKYFFSVSYGRSVRCLKN